MMKLMLPMFLLVLASSAAVAAPGLIDFETVPGMAPADQLPIASQYQSPFGVTFSLSTGGTPFLERAGAGDAGHGFLNNGLGVFDAAATGFASQLQSYYLRIGTGTLQVGTMPQLVIGYSTPVAAASAQIWDIDGNASGTEQWLVEAFDGSASVVDSILSPLGTTQGAASLDGKPWTWSFDHAGVADIHQIRLSFVGSKTGGIGLAFDNFAPSSPVPEPGARALLAIGVLALLGVRAACRADEGRRIG